MFCYGGKERRGGFVKVKHVEERHLCDDQTADFYTRMRDVCMMERMERWLSRDEDCKEKIFIHLYQCT